jgi:hypothetical protein
LIALDYNNSFSGRGRNSKWRDFGNHYLWFSNGTGFAAAMIVGTLVDPMATLLNANGDVVSAMLITEFRKVAFKHVDYIIYRQIFIKQKQPFCYGTCL